MPLPGASFRPYFADVIPVSQLSIMQNLAQIDYCRTSAAVASGCTAGILGLTGVYGFIFYFIFATVITVSKLDTQSHILKYFAVS